MVGEESSEAGAEEIMEGGAGGEELVCTEGRAGEAPKPDTPCEFWDWRGRGSVKLGLGEGRLTRTLRLFEVPFGLGLRLLSCEMGDVKPLLPPGNSKGTGATMAIDSIASLSSMSRIRASAALSRTVGTD